MNMLVTPPLSAHSVEVIAPTWTDERIQTLKDLWAQGYPASKIANVLGGITRNAVIGKISRLKLPKREKGVNQHTTRTIVTARTRRVLSPHGNSVSAAKPRVRGDLNGFAGVNAVRRKAAEEYDLPPESVDDQLIPAEQRRTLLELTSAACRWPVGDPSKEDFFFCGAVADGDKPYCHAHCVRAYVPPVKRPEFSKEELARRVVQGRRNYKKTFEAA